MDGVAVEKNPRRNGRLGGTMAKTNRGGSRIVRALAASVALAAVTMPVRADPPGSISGTVTDEGSNPIAAACADVFYAADGGVAASVITAADGTYVATDLPAGDYKVSIDPCGAGDYYPEWYDDRSGFEDATLVPVASGSETSGIDAQLTTSFIPPAGPQNDAFADATEIAATPFARGQPTSLATLEEGEPAPCGPVGSTVWFRYTPAEPRPTVVTTVTSEFDTIVAVYTGTDLAALTPVGCSNDVFAPHDRGGVVSFVATAGTTYYVQAGGFEGAQGFLRVVVA